MKKSIKKTLIFSTASLATVGAGVAIIFSIPSSPKAPVPQSSISITAQGTTNLAYDAPVEIDANVLNASAPIS
jgi:hypothetical protein